MMWREKIDYRCFRVIIFGCISMFAIGLVFAGQGVAKVDPKTAYLVWSFEEGAGDTVKDLSGNGNDGELTNVKWVKGKTGNGLQLSGAGCKIATTTANGVSKTYFSEVLWINFVDFTNEAMYGYIQSVGTPNARYFYFSSWNSAGAPHDAMHCGTLDAGGNWGRGISTPGKQYKAGQWHFVAGVIDTKAGTIKVYVDGNMVQQMAMAAGDTPGEPKTIWVGGSPENYQWINGTIDDVAFFNVALSDDDINDIMKNGLTKAFAVDSSDKLSVTWGQVKNR